MHFVVQNCSLLTMRHVILQASQRSSIRHHDLAHVGCSHSRPLRCSYGVCVTFTFCPIIPIHQLSKTRITLSPLRNILLIKRSLLTPLPPALFFSVHISLTFSSTMLQCLSKAFTRASSFRLLRHDMRTCVWVRVAVMRMDNVPVVSS